ncbi:MAG TPA: hypothetical protein VFK37_04150 [Bacillales bacterium]|nr:hypothetical protein [Bacillales bacterium]
MILIVFVTHFLIMGSLVLLVSGGLTFLFPRLPFFFLVLLCMIAGFLYAVIAEVPQLIAFAVILNGVLSLFAIGIVKLGYYAKHQAEKPNA